MKPYRELFPHAGLVLPNTEEVAGRVVVLPTGATIGSEEIAAVTGIFRLLASERPGVGFVSAVS